jgi:tether containing UBX domain for GLUT4
VPPKREIKVSDPTVRDVSLYDLQLSPSSVLLIKFLDENLNRQYYPITKNILLQLLISVRD